MLARVNAPPRSWNAPTSSPAVGAIRNIAAKTKNGATPAQAAQSAAARRGAGAEAGGGAPVGVAGRARPRRAARRPPVRSARSDCAADRRHADASCLGASPRKGGETPDSPRPPLFRHRRADDGVPFLRDHLLGRLLLVERRELGLGVAIGGRKGRDEVGWNLSGRDQIGEADRVAVALEPGRSGPRRNKGARATAWRRSDGARRR